MKWEIHTGDGLEDIPACDHVITDPPYDAKTHAGAASNRGNGNFVHLVHFAPLESCDFVPRLLGAAQRWVIAFCSLEQVGSYRDAAGEAWIRAGIWDRVGGMPQLSGDRPAQGAEGIAIMHRKGAKRWNGGGHRALWTCGIERTERLHPTQKPLRLMLALVEQFTDPGELVFDPFCGSATTGVACALLGRDFIGYEIDPATADVGRERMRAACSSTTVEAQRSGQLAMFGGVE